LMPFDFDNPVWPTLITIFGPPRPLGFQSESDPFVI
jgi:hypothetical protein